MHLLSFVHRGYLHESIHSVEHAYSFFDRSYSFLMEIKFVSQPVHEHLFDDAIAVLKTTHRYTLVAQVVDAALEEQTALGWVIQACRQQAEHIMNGAKATYYQAAALWLTKARTAYHIVGRDETWHAYLNDLLERHQYKSKLLPLLTALSRDEQEGC